MGRRTNSTRPLRSRGEEPISKTPRSTSTPTPESRRSTSSSDFIYYNDYQERPSSPTVKVEEGEGVEVQNFEGEGVVVQNFEGSLAALVSNFNEFPTRFRFGGPIEVSFCDMMCCRLMLFCYLMIFCGFIYTIVPWDLGFSNFVQDFSFDLGKVTNWFPFTQNEAELQSCKDDLELATGFYHSNIEMVRESCFQHTQHLINTICALETLYNRLFHLGEDYFNITSFQCY